MLLHAIRYDEPPLADEVNHALPPAVSRVLQTALSKRLEDRPPNAEFFVQELRTALGSRLAYLMRDLRSALEPHVASLFKPEPRLPSEAAQEPPTDENGQSDSADVEPSSLETVPLLPPSGTPQAWSPPKSHRAPEESGGHRGDGAVEAPSLGALPQRIPDELEQFGAAGVKQVAIFGRNADVCPACAGVRAQTYLLDVAPVLPLQECASKWGCHCEYVPLIENGQEIPRAFLPSSTPASAITRISCGCAPLVHAVRLDKSKLMLSRLPALTVSGRPTPTTPPMSRCFHRPAVHAFPCAIVSINWFDLRRRSTSFTRPAARSAGSSVC